MQSEAGAKTLRDLNFKIGDYMDVSIFGPRSTAANARMPLPSCCSDPNPLRRRRESMGADTAERSTMDRRDFGRDRREDGPRRGPREEEPRERRERDEDRYRRDDRRDRDDRRGRDDRRRED